MKKFALFIIGPPCSGKSTLCEAIGERYPGTYLVSFDKIKWQISWYTRVKDKEIIKQLTHGMYELVFTLGIPILYQPFFHDEEEYQSAYDFAVRHDYVVNTVAIPAPV